MCQFVASGLSSLQRLHFAQKWYRTIFGGPTHSWAVAVLLISSHIPGTPNPQHLETNGSCGCRFVLLNIEPMLLMKDDWDLLGWWAAKQLSRVIQLRALLPKSVAIASIREWRSEHYLAELNAKVTYFLTERVTQSCEPLHLCILKMFLSLWVAYTLGGVDCAVKRIWPLCFYISKWP